MAELFASLAPTPLAERLRPKRIGDVLGQDHLLGPDGPLGRMLAAKKLASLILWGPPGCGKTTIARLLAEAVDLHFEPLSAVFSGVADLRKVFEAARQRRKDGKGTLLFVDEIHRFNRAQQDGFLPYVEDGTVTLVGNIAPKVEIGLQSVVTRQIRLQGSCASCGEYPACISMMASGAIAVEPLITAVASLEDGASWFDRLYKREPGLLKVVLQP